MKILRMLEAVFATDDWTVSVLDTVNRSLSGLAHDLNNFEISSDDGYRFLLVNGFVPNYGRKLVLAGIGKGPRGKTYVATSPAFRQVLERVVGKPLKTRELYVYNPTVIPIEDFESKVDLPSNEEIPDIARVFIAAPIDVPERTAASLLVKEIHKELARQSKEANAAAQVGSAIARAIRRMFDARIKVLTPGEALSKISRAVRMELEEEVPFLFNGDRLAALEVLIPGRKKPVLILVPMEGSGIRGLTLISPKKITKDVILPALSFLQLRGATEGDKVGKILTYTNYNDFVKVTFSVPVGIDDVSRTVAEILGGRK